MYWPSVQGWQCVWVSRLCRTVLWTALPAGRPAPSPVVPWWGPCCQTPLCTLHKDTSYNTCQQPVIHFYVHCTRIQVTTPVNNQSYTSVCTAQGYKLQHLSATSHTPVCALHKDTSYNTCQQSVIHLHVHCTGIQVTTPVSNQSYTCVCTAQGYKLQHLSATSHTPPCTLHRDTSYNTCQQPVIHLCVHCPRIQVTTPVNNLSVLPTRQCMWRPKL